MYKGTIKVTTAITENTTIPFKTAFNSNNVLSADNGAVKILKPGYYRISVVADLVGVSEGDIGLVLAVNDVVLQEATAGGTSTAATDNITLTTTTAIKVFPSLEDDFVTVTAYLTEDASMLNGVMVIERVK